MKVKRAVIDSNVLISALLSPQSVPAQLVNGLLEQACLVFSRETFAEFETRLWRPKFDRYIDIEQRRRLLHHLAAVTQWTRLPEQPLPKYSRDPDDDVFIHTALYSQAQWLVSGDKDLLELQTKDWTFEIRSPAQALEKWHSQ